MTKRVMITAMFVLAACVGWAQVSKEQRQKFVSANFSHGTVFQTNDFITGDNKIPYYNSYSVRYGFTSKARSVYDYVYGLPYWGVGLYKLDLPGRAKDFGHPMSIYLLQGARLVQFTDRLKINYEWNLGLSFNWKHYDQFTSPSNTVIGASTNVHISGSLYLKWIATKHLDFNIGASATHFSNGSSRTPNSGMNMAALFAGVAYSFDRNSIAPKKYAGDEVADFTRRVDHEISVVISRRSIEVDTVGNDLVFKYPNRTFRVLGVNYSPLVVSSLRYKWGPSMEFLYDESAGVYARHEKDPTTGQLVDRLYPGSVGDRISLGFSAMGELSMPYYSIFAHLGYDVVRSKHNHPEESRFYQVIGTKIYLSDSVFGTFGIRATRFGSAQFLYWSVGYRIKGKGVRSRRG